jgi:hypothetical protein
MLSVTMALRGSVRTGLSGGGSDGEIQRSDMQVRQQNGSSPIGCNSYRSGDEHDVCDIVAFITVLSYREGRNMMECM